MTSTGAADADNPLARTSKAAKLDVPPANSVDRMQLELKAVS